MLVKTMSKAYSGNALIPTTIENESLIGRSSAFFIYCGIYLKDLIEGFGLPGSPLLFLIAGTILGLVDVVRRGSMKECGLAYILWIVVVWLGNSILNQNVSTSNYFIAPILAFFVLKTAPRTFVILLVAHLFISLSIQGYEYFTGNYLFVYVSDKAGVLDEKFFSGGADLVRSKGLFQGPLSAVAFSAWMAFYFRRSIVTATLMLLSAYFSSGRLGLVVAFILLITRIFWSDGANRKYWKKLAWFAVVLMAAAALFYTARDEQQLFIINAINLDSAGNIARISYWNRAVQLFLDYDLLSVLFGRFGSVKEAGGTESDLLHMLLDNGLSCFIIYIVALAHMFIIALRQRSNEMVLIALLIFTMMNIFPFIQSISSTLLFWLYLFANLQIANTHRSGSMIIAKREHIQTI